MPAFPGALDAVAGVGVGAVEEHADVDDLEVGHAGGTSGRSRARQIGARQQQVDILGRADRGGILGRDPERHRLPADQREGHAGIRERFRDPLETSGDSVQGAGEGRHIGSLSPNPNRGQLVSGALPMHF